MTIHEQEQDDPPRPFSIDLTLELERQLDDESNPNSPVDANERPHSLDSHVLASIVTQLRLSLADITSERDELSQTVTKVRAREAETADLLKFMTEKCTKVQEELDNARTKIKDDEDTISILRTKVEESRRGLMRLQSENRRASHVPSALDLSRAGIPSFNGPPSSKRASLIVSTAGRNNTHRRISSVSENSSFDSSHLSSPIPTSTPTSSTLPDVQKSKTQQPSHTRRMSGMFARGSPPQSLFPSEESAELEMLRRELNAVKAELDDVKHELSETNEAREASDTCIKALRGFIEENQVGAVPKTLPPLPAEVKKAPPPPPPATGWGFKLWRADSVSQSPAVVSPPPVAPLAQTVSPPQSSLTAPVPLSKKLGDFFGARATAATTSQTPHRVDQEPMYNGMSDTSSIEDSVAEPISPASERPRPAVYVRDTTSVTSCSSRDLDVNLEGKLPPSCTDETLVPVDI
ncbi:hypothetical protein BDR04DRAFT_1142878 [Suillus decipiens]|nr:hypothetical protein BDR04DRAFT_1142878 [Suillus decipiens]